MAKIAAANTFLAEAVLKMIVLDTDHYSFLEYPDSREFLRLSARIAQLHSSDRVVVSVITYEEKARGRLASVNASRTPEDRIEAYAQLRQHVQNFQKTEIVDYDAESEAIYQNLLKARIRIGTLDLRIAAICLSRNALLLSRNLADFRKVPNLRVEDWTV